jgi:hypothetical protein
LSQFEPVGWKVFKTFHPTAFFGGDLDSGGGSSLSRDSCSADSMAVEFAVEIGDYDCLGSVA